jgi:hypothetical protein
MFLLCRVMDVSRSGYYSWKSRGKSVLDLERIRLIPRVKAIHRQSRGSYGARRISEGWLYLAIILDLFSSPKRLKPNQQLRQEGQGRNKRDKHCKTSKEAKIDSGQEIRKHQDRKANHNNHRSVVHSMPD